MSNGATPRDVGDAGAMTTVVVTMATTTATTTTTKTRGALGPYAIIWIAYILYTLTEGAVRMLVLMHAYAKGFSAMEVAVMFTMYELCGAGTNLVAGVAGARFGIRATLASGLTLQVVGLGMLYAWDDAWDRTEAIIFVTCAQALCGIAKDLTKLGGQSVKKRIRRN